MSTLAKKLNAALNLTSKLAVVSGGSQGIGAGVAMRFAEAGSSVIIIGRNERLLSKVINDCKRMAKDGPAGKIFEYIEADLSLISGINKAANDIKAKSKGVVNYLVQTQGGTPNGRYQDHSGMEFHFAVQIVSRFALNHILASSGVLKDASVNVCAPGGSQTAFDLEDIECQSSRNSFAVSLLLAMAKRDGLITDTYTKGLQALYPNISFYHLFPGLVATNNAANQGFPFPLPQLYALASPIISRTIGNSPTSYSDIPVLLAANDSAEKQELVMREGRFLDQSLKKVRTSPWSEVGSNQEQTVEKLIGYLK